MAIKWVVRGEPWRVKARKFLRDSLAAGFGLIAPPLFEYETESVLQGLLESKALTLAKTDTALDRLCRIGVRYLTHPDLVRRARGIARQFHQSKIYDSLFAALADLRGCEFWTADKQFHDAVKGKLKFVKFLPDYP